MNNQKNIIPKNNNIRIIKRNENNNNNSVNIEKYDYIQYNINHYHIKNQKLFFLNYNI